MNWFLIALCNFICFLKNSVLMKQKGINIWKINLLKFNFKKTLSRVGINNYIILAIRNLAHESRQEIWIHYLNFHMEKSVPTIWISPCDNLGKFFFCNIWNKKLYQLSSPYHTTFYDTLLKMEKPWLLSFCS